MISQDTSAYGVDVKYRTGFWRGKPVQDAHDGAVRGAGRARRVGAAALRLSVSARRRRDSADGRGQDPAVPRRAVPAREPAHPEADEAPGAARERRSSASARWRAICPDITIRSTFIVGFPGETEAEFEELLEFLDEAQLDRVGCFAYSPVDGAAANALPDPVPEEVKEERRARFMAAAGGDQRGAARSARSARRCDVLVDAVDGDGAIARSRGRRAGDRRRGAFQGRQARASSPRY